MIAIGMALAFGAYTLGVYGYCLMRSYNVTFGDLWQPVWPGGTGNPAAGNKRQTYGAPSQEA